MSSRSTFELSLIGFDSSGEEVFRHFRLKSVVDVPDDAFKAEICFLSHQHIKNLQFFRDQFKTEAFYSAGEQRPVK